MGDMVDIIDDRRAAGSLGWLAPRWWVDRIVTPEILRGACFFFYIDFPGWPTVVGIYTHP